MSIPENDTQLWKGFNGHGLYAKRAERDREGNKIIDTYAKKTDVSALTDSLTTSTTTAVTPNAVKSALDSIVKIPATANQPSTLYAGNQGMRWTGWESEEVDVPVLKKLLYLTYFTDFNENTKTDNSLVGDGKIVFSGVGTHSFPKLDMMQSSIPSMKWYNVNLVTASTGCTIEDSVDTISIEFFASAYFPGDYGTCFKLGYLYVSYGGVIDGYRLDTSYAAPENLLFYNGASYDSNWGQWVRYKPASESGVNIAKACTMHFYSCVVDFKNTEVFLYVDGQLICKATGINVTRDVTYHLDTHRTDHWTNVTQCAIFNYAKNSDDKMTYPVPESPYDPSVVEAP